MSCLKSLSQDDPNHVIIARRVHALGAASTEALTLHFSGFGPVRKVLTTQSKKAAGRCKIRPGGIAYVVMADAKSADFPNVNKLSLHAVPTIL